MNKAYVEKVILAPYENGQIRNGVWCANLTNSMKHIIISLIRASFNFVFVHYLPEPDNSYWALIIIDLYIWSQLFAFMSCCVQCRAHVSANVRICVSYRAILIRICMCAMCVSVCLCARISVLMSSHFIRFFAMCLERLFAQFSSIDMIAKLALLWLKSANRANSADVVNILKSSLHCVERVMVLNVKCFTSNICHNALLFAYYPNTHPVRY